MTDYEDMKKALHDGRLEKIIDEFLEYREETFVSDVLMRRRH